MDIKAKGGLSGSKLGTWARLVSLNENFRNLDLVENDFVIGRNPRFCHAVLTDGRISGKHCCFSKYNVNDLSPDEEKVFVKRLKEKAKDFKFAVFLENYSDNGTFINDYKIGKGSRIPIKSGDEISFLTKNEKTTENFIMTYIFNLLNDGEDNFSSDKSKFHEKYSIGENLGIGNFSLVNLCTNLLTGTNFSVKIIDKHKWSHPKSKENIQREIDILHKVDHPNIIHLVEAFESNNFIYLVLQLATGGDLFDRLANNGAFSPEHSRLIFVQLLEALKYLHSLDIAHRDIKPENILFADTSYTSIYLIDFGLSRRVDAEGYMKTLCGTPQYVAPEIVLQAQQNEKAESERKGYGKAVDMWSAGIILYAILSGIPPFNEADENIPIHVQIVDGLYTFPQQFFEDVPTEAQDLITKLLATDPTKRFSAAQALTHPWIKIIS